MKRTPESGWHSVNAEDDGLPATEVGAWAEDKYRIVALYDELFSTGMKNKWPTRVYLDLYAGPGFSRIKGTNHFIAGSPLLALAVSDPFDKYIFCESAPEAMAALKKRVARLFPRKDVRFVPGDCNERIGEVCAEIPQGSKDHGVLSLCFLDPFDISLKFTTVRRLGSFYLDFLFLLALHMDANRNVASYLSLGNAKADEFLGLSDWRERWRIAESGGTDFPHFLADEYSNQMERLGYLAMPYHKMKLIRSDEKNLPLYHLALFSRDKLAHKYWDDVLKYSTPQRNFGF